MMVHRDRKREDMRTDVMAVMIDLNGMTVEINMEISDADGRYYVWLEQPDDRDDLEEEFPGLGEVWDESAADCERFGVRSYDNLDELNNSISAFCGDGETVFFVWDDLLECVCGV